MNESRSYAGCSVTVAVLLLDSMKRVGVREIAEAARVSIGTVDRALNGRKEISKRTRERILAIAGKLGYVPNPAARALSVSRTTVRIGVCIPAEIESFYAPLWRGIQEEVERYGFAGVELLRRSVRTLESDQTRAIRRLLAEKIDGLILTPGNPGVLVPLIDAAEHEHDVRVVCVATDSSASRRSSTVSVEPRMNGMLAADLMANFVPAGSRVAVVTGSLSTEDHARKAAGFEAFFPSACPGGSVLPVIEGHEDRETTFSRCRQLVRKHSGLAGIYVSTANCLPVCRALAAEGAGGRIRVVATDLSPEVAPLLGDRTIAAVIHQRPGRQGQISVRLLLDHLLHGRPLPPARYLNPAIVMRPNLSLFLDAAGSGSPGPERLDREFAIGYSTVTGHGPGKLPQKIGRSTQ